MSNQANISQALPGAADKSAGLSANYLRKKQAAVAAAAQVFAEKGFHGATTKDIAACMGIKQGSLYYYFKSKEEALQEVCEFALGSYLERMRSICDKEKPFDTQLLAIITAHLSAYREQNSALKVHNDQRLHLPRERRTRIKELGSEYRALLEHVIERGITNGDLRSSVDAHFVAYTIIGVCNAWGASLMRDANLDLFSTVQQCVDLIAEGLKKTTT